MVGIWMFVGGYWWVAHYIQWEWARVLLLRVMLQKCRQRTSFHTTNFMSWKKQLCEQRVCKTMLYPPPPADKRKGKGAGDKKKQKQAG